MKLRQRPGGFLGVYLAASGLALLCIAGVIPGSAQAQEDKLSVDDLIRKHLDSIGSEEVLSERKSFVLVGTCKHEILVGGRTNIDGTAQLISEGDALNFLIDFARGDYNGEQFVTDGKKVNTGFSVPGTRFPLADFLFAQKSILREGLFGGTLTTAWPLLNLDEKNPRLKLSGTEKVDGQELLELDYDIRRGGSDANIKIYFHPENFSHVLTTYDVRISARLGATPEQSAGQRVSRFKLEERFSDFKDFSGLSLPSTWVVQFSTHQTGRTSLWQWTMRFEQSSYNQEIPASFFAVQ